MKKRQYTRKKKIAMLLFFILCMCITATGALGFYFVNNVSAYLFSKTELLGYKTFEQTETLELKILEDTSNLLEYVHLGSVFGDSDRENRRTVIFHIQSAGKNYPVCIRDLEQLYQLEEKHTRPDYNGLSEAIALECGEIFQLPEDFKVTVLYNYVEGSERGEETTLDTLYIHAMEYLNRFYKLKNLLASDEINLKYVIAETDGKILASNLSGVKKGTDDWGNDILVTGETITSLGKYVLFDNNDHSFKTNMDKSDVYSSGLDETASELKGTERGVSLAVGLDMGYQYVDEYRKMSENYLKCRPILILSIPLVLLGMIGAAIGFFYLLAAVGHQEDFDEIRLDRFDQWPTEVAFVLIVGGIVVFNTGIGVFTNMMADTFFTSRLIFYVMQTVAVIISVIIGMVGFFSMVKRMKAGTIWSNSLSRKLFKLIAEGLRKTVGHWNSAFRVMALIIIYWIVSIPLIMVMAVYQEELPSRLLILLVVAFVLIQLVAAGIIIWQEIAKKDIQEGIEMLTYGNLDYTIDTQGMFFGDKQLAEGINNIGAGLQEALDTAVRSERMKADLITNVSHDIKTPLTSIINYVDLMKREKTDNEKMARYIQILDEKSARLKTLTEDLVEASRASSGNINLQMEKINYVEIVRQACGEFEDKFEERGLKQVMTLLDHPAYIYADGRRIWRVLENLFTNVKKYAMPGTRVYIELAENDETVTFTMKNISEYPISISTEELAERFTRGDSSRTTEGSGLGLSIAKSLTELQGGFFDIYLNGDLYRVSVEFKLYDDAESAD